MNRRSFLTLTGAAATGFLLDPEVLLWVPGKKTFFFVHQPVRTVSFAELVAVTLNTVLGERSREGRFGWSDKTLLYERVRQEHDRLLRERRV